MPKRTKPYHEARLKALQDPVYAFYYLREAFSTSPKMGLIALRKITEANMKRFFPAKNISPKPT